MRKRHQTTLDAVFRTPVSPGIRWQDVQSLLAALGAEIEEREGSRVAVVLKGRVAVFHRPHPRPEMDKGAVVALRRFLENAGVEP